MLYVCVNSMDGFVQGHPTSRRSSTFQQNGLAVEGGWPAVLEGGLSSVGGCSGDPVHVDW